MTLKKWDLNRYIKVLREKEKEKSYNEEIIFFESCVLELVQAKDAQKYSTILHSFLKNEIDIKLLRVKFISLRGQHVRLSYKIIKKIESAVDLSLTYEEIERDIQRDIQIEWRPEFQVLDDKIDYIYNLIEDYAYYLIYKRSKYANEVSETAYLQTMILEHIYIFKKLS